MTSLIGEDVLSQRPRPQALDIAAEAITAYQARNWRRFAQLVHVEELKAFQAEHIEHARNWDDFPAVIETDSTVPPEIAKYFNEMRARTYALVGNPALRAFAGVDSIAHLERLSPADALIRYFEGVFGATPHDSTESPVATRAILGSALEGDSLTHVLYRLQPAGEASDATDGVFVLTLRRTESDWRILLNDDLGGGERMVGITSEVPLDQ